MLPQVLASKSVIGIFGNLVVVFSCTSALIRL